MIDAVTISTALAASLRESTPGIAHSNANIDSVIVSREASRMMLAVVLAAMLKFKTPKGATLA